MTPRYVRSEPGRIENVTAALISGTLAAGVGLVAFYFFRLLLSREPMGDGGGPPDVDEVEE